MFKRFKSLAMMLTVFILLIGGSHFVSNAAMVEGERESIEQPMEKKASDDMFYIFYKRLLEQWNIQYDVHHPLDKEDTNNRPKENIEEKNPHVPEEMPEREQEKEEKEEQVEGQNPVEQQPEYNEEQSQNELNAFELKVFELTNIERSNNGLEPLQVDRELSRVAREKSRDMAENYYFDHHSPVYGSPFDMIRSYGITYQTAGENIAKGQQTPEEVVQAWMNSSGHRANILNPNFTHIGVGFVENGNHWTQQFIGK